MAARIKQGRPGRRDLRQDKGKRGKVLKVLAEQDRVIVEGVTASSATPSRRRSMPQGGIIEKERRSTSRR